MQQVDATLAADWLTGQGWIVLSADGSYTLRVTGGAGLMRHRVQIDQDSASVGCGMASVFLHDVDPATFAGGLLWVTNTSPPDADNLRFARQVIRGCGADGFDWPGPLFFRFGNNDFDACFSMLSLALMFGWDASLVVAGRRLLIEADNDQLPLLITDTVSDWLASALANFEAEITPWPFTSRFVAS